MKLPTAQKFHEVLEFVMFLWSLRYLSN